MTSTGLKEGLLESPSAVVQAERYSVVSRRAPTQQSISRPKRSTIPGAGSEPARPQRTGQLEANRVGLAAALLLLPRIVSYTNP